MEEGEQAVTGVSRTDSESLRLTDVQLRYRLSERDERLGLLDIFREDLIFHMAMIRSRWAVGEITCVGLAFSALVLGSWDLGVGELATGGDYNRVGLAGFRNLSDLSLMMALLSVLHPYKLLYFQPIYHFQMMLFLLKHELFRIYLL